MQFVLLKMDRNFRLESKLHKPAESRWTKFEINVYELWQMSKNNIESDRWRMVRSYKKGWVPTLLGPKCPKKRNEKKTALTDRPVQMSAMFISTRSIFNFELNCFKCCVHTPDDFWFSFYNSNIGCFFSIPIVFRIRNVEKQNYFDMKWMGLSYVFIRKATPVAVRKQREIISFHLLNLNYYFPNRDNIWDHIVF